MFSSSCTSSSSSSSACLSSAATTTTVYSTINKSKCSTKTDDPSVKSKESVLIIARENSEEQSVSVDVSNVVAEKPDVLCDNVADSAPETNLKRKLEDAIAKDKESSPPPPAKRPKQNDSDQSHHPLMNLSNNHPLKKHSKMNRNGENTATKNSFSSTTSSSSPRVVILEHDIILPAGSVASLIHPKSTNIDGKSRPVSSPPLSLSKSSGIMSTKASIIPAKVPSTTYIGGQKPPCYMPKTTYNQVLNVPKPMVVNSK